MKPVSYENPVAFTLDKQGRIQSIGDFKFKQPIEINIERAYLDNDRKVCFFRTISNAKQCVYERIEENGVIVLKGGLEKNCFAPIMTFELTIKPFEDGLEIEFEYETADYLKYLPRIGLEFAVDKKYSNIRYTGFGPSESYVDKRLASDYGTYHSTAKKEYFPWIKPQETGSHWGSTELVIENCCRVEAEKPFSFSVLPYSTKQLMNAKHDFELPRSNATYVNLDIAMSGIGSASCGTVLDEKYYTPRTGKNVFRIYLEK